LYNYSTIQTNNLEELYEQFKADMNDDFLGQRKMSLDLAQDEIEALTCNNPLQDIDNYLNQSSPRH